MTKRILLIVVAVVAISWIAAIWRGQNNDSAQLTAGAEAAASAASISGASSENKTKADATPEKNYGYVVLAARTLKNSMRDPDSFKLESAYVINDTGVVCFEYRSRNGFGGMNKGAAVLEEHDFIVLEQSPGRFRKAWNKECAHKDGIEAEASVSARL